MSFLVRRNCLRLSFLLRYYGTASTKQPSHLCSQPSFWTHPLLIKKNEITPGISGNEYNERQIALMNSLPENSVTIIASSSLTEKSYNVSYPFHQNSYFFYLTGLMEPDCLLFLRKASANSTQSIIFCPEPKQFDIQWNDRISSLAAIRECFGFDNVLGIQALKKLLPSLLTKNDKIYCITNHHPIIDNQIKMILNPLKYQLNPLMSFIDKLRFIKSKNEMNVIKSGSEILSESFLETMQKVRPGSYEYSVISNFQYNITSRGSVGMCNEPVITSGKTSYLLNNTFCKAALNGGELINFQAGCEYHGYSSYVARTWPVSGEFSEPQKKIYSIIYNAYIGGINRLRMKNQPVSLNDLYKIVIKLLCQGLYDYKVMKNNTLKSIIERKLYLKVFPHHVSNWLGIDPIDTPSISFDEKLIPGNVFTFGAAIYINPKLPEITEEYKGISARISNVIAINHKNEPEILTKSIPITISDIEKVTKV